MMRAIPVLAALLATSTGRGQVAWVVDTTFRTDIEWRSVTDIDFTPNGLLVSGEFKYLGDYNYPRYLTFLDENGQHDAAFTSGGGGGRIRWWGDRFYVGNAQGVMRKFADGATDYSYDVDDFFVNSIHGGDFYTYPDGRVLMTGGSDLWSTVDTSFLGGNYCLVRFDTTGALDPTFQHRQCQSGITQRILPLADGKFLLAGVQNFYDGQPVGHILRVHADGAIDTTFHTTIDYGYATDYYFYLDGRILCSGAFHTPELPGDTVQLLRLMPDGSVDQSFNYDLHFLKFPEGNYPPAVVQGMYELEPGVLLVGGSFTTLNDEWVGGVLAMDTAGNILQDYFPGMGCDSLISLPNILTLGLRDFEMSPEGDLYAYGFFHGFDDGYINDPEQRMIVKLKRVNVGMEEQPERTSEPAAYPNPGGDEVRIDWPGHKIRAWVIHALDGRVVPMSGANPHSFSSNKLARGVYVLGIMDTQGVTTRLQWIKQ